MASQLRRKERLELFLEETGDFMWKNYIIHRSLYINGKKPTKLVMMKQWRKVEKHISNWFVIFRNFVAGQLALTFWLQETYNYLFNEHPDHYFVPTKTTTTLEQKEKR
jgi:hypothetical protein